MSQIKVEQNLLKANDDIAQELRKKYQENGVKVINMISSPGAGKTTLLEHSLEKIASKYKVGVIEGDILTSRDAERIEKLNVPVVQIETKGACHLDARMINKALEQLKLEELDLIIIENVGNLVCPASFDLGEDAKVVVLSIAEGADKPAKYPSIFTKAKVCVLNKIDLLPYSNFSIDDFYADVKKVNPKIESFEIAATKDIGIDKWVDWLEGLIIDGGTIN
ncbi:hydrogenase nickel incorporation protein HypB [Desulfonispora thiosulfatigenes DSM 11270]|uniref:Hydrogenase nickel incorporation protein HypB n=1 Tax=Desulfonispora thiosulfatigenes DSM 11270 TaxID=656914 RepID=A0A1W1VHG4_DESTI|nr:hydrogenase nickel incorporation protein HypB [Desulfonispora thiosulfatigenes]SMB92693.1 hydrogenase nickel incorporation protein HypB [Desulfonispora thiosulfatigenes DSM 11270]